MDIEMVRGIEIPGEAEVRRTGRDIQNEGRERTTRKKGPDQGNSTSLGGFFFHLEPQVIIT